MTDRLFNRRGAVVLAIVALVLLTATLGHRMAVQSTSPLSLLADDYRTGGGAGVVRWAEKIGFVVTPLQDPLWEVTDELSGPGNCAITAGNDSWSLLEDELSAEQWYQVSRWVQRGNALIIISSDVDSLPEPVREHFTEGRDDEQTPSLTPASENTTDDNEERFTSVETEWGGELAVTRRGPRLVSAPEDWVLAGTSASAVLVQRMFGEGRIYLMLDEYAWTNDGFDSADNAAALARVLGRELTPEGVLAIDHYRHGHGRVESFSTFLFSLPGAKDCGGMLLLIGLLWLWARNRRLGPVEEFHETERRTAAEYIEAVATMAQRARAAPLAVESVADRVNYLLHQRGGVSDAGRELVDRAQRLVRQERRPAAPSDEIDLVRDLIQLRRNFYGTRTDS